jgi:glycosyltransferase involved in cell wall biosynthesis
VHPGVVTAPEPTGPEPAPVGTIVVPCYNEARRLDRDALLGLARDGSVRLLFVDDGSTDATPAALRGLAGESDAIEVLTLDVNQGKAEAVRRGMVHALDGPSPLIGYYDGDLATPPAELLRLVAALGERPDVECVLGARVALLGSAIERRPVRHYAGRLFASAASAALGVQVYDTQCGAKVFRVSPALRAAIAAPFRSRWAFDVELLDRLLRGGPSVAAIGPEQLLEVPLHAWRDVPGSGMSLRSGLEAFCDVGRIGWSRTRARDSRTGR